MENVDVSFKTFLKETGKKTYIRTGLFRRKREKTLSNAPQSEKTEYYSWRSTKLAEAQRKEIELRQAQLKIVNDARKEVGLPPIFRLDEYEPFAGFDELVLNILNTPSAREVANKKKLEQIERINSVDLSLESEKYIGENSIESKYPGLIDAIFSNVSEYGNTLRDDEEYAQVVVTDTINNKSEILSHIEWLVAKPGSTLDVELRDVNEMGSWVLQTTEDVGLGAGGRGYNSSVKQVERPKPPRPRPILPQLSIPIGEIKKDAIVIGSSKLIPFDQRYLNNVSGKKSSSGGGSRREITNIIR